MNWLSDVSNILLGPSAPEQAAVPTKQGDSRLNQADSITVIATGASRCVLRLYLSIRMM
jgi:hypothetical protein